VPGGRGRPAHVRERRFRADDGLEALHGRRAPLRRAPQVATRAPGPVPRGRRTAQGPARVRAGSPAVIRAARGLTLALAILGGALGAQPAAAASGLPPVRHVFVIVLENESVSTTFGPNSPAPYLAKTLTAQGAYVPGYFGIGHESNDNYIAMISGQAPNPQNQADCFSFSNFAPDVIGPNGQAVGSGCVFPSDVKTVADQFGTAGLTWRDYNQSMGADPSREAAECGHPGINQRDGTESATATDQYAARHNPFVYFHSIIDD